MTSTFGIVAPASRLWSHDAMNSDPPLPRWIHEAWNREGRKRLKGSERYKPEGQALIWFVAEWLHARSAYRYVLPQSVVEWLNATDLDLTKELTSRPSVNGLVRSDEFKPVTRFMRIAWELYGRPYSFDRAESYYEFLSWYALSVVPARNLPGSLLPVAVINLLNAPAGERDLPLTVGMLLHIKSAYPGEIENIRSARPERLLAMSFRAVKEILSKGDPRLIPPAVSAFWLHRPLTKELITAFEYVVASVHNGSESPLIADEKQLREWFHQHCLDTFRGAQLVSGLPNCPEARPENGSHVVHDGAVLIYRDHQTVAGLSKAGLIARNALSASGIETFDLHYSLCRQSLSEEAEKNRRLWINARRKLHLLNLNPESVPECCYVNLNRFGPKDYIVGQFYWELSRTCKAHEPGLGIVDEIWTASKYLTEIYTAATDKPVVTMGQAVVVKKPSSPLHRADFNFPEDAFLFLSSFDAMSVVERKNPLGTVAAFQAAFPRDDISVGLIIKTRGLANLQTESEKAHWAKADERIRRDRRIRVIDQTMSEDAIAALYQMCDCFVSLHRSEGFGYGPAEAMAHGKPVVVTNYSGVCDFCTEENAKLVPYKLIRLEPKQYPYMDADCVYEWADPDLESAARHMRELASNRETSRRLGLEAQARVTRQFSIAALRKRYVDRLAELGFL